MDRLYLDLCCYKRPFDDQTEERVQKEAAAVAAILERAAAGTLALVRSLALRLENSQNPREDRRLAVALWLDQATTDVPLTELVAERARILTGFGFTGFDAFHLAFAEAAGARYFVTCDDRVIRLAERHGDAVRVPVVRPDKVPLEEAP